MVTGRTDQNQPSIFVAESLLRETRRQRNLSPGPVPSVCLLDPDGDMVRSLQQSGCERSDVWACYHTEMWLTDFDGIQVGVVGCAVGSPYAVLIAEQLFASGCQLLISITSSGQLDPDLQAPCFVLITESLRGEGTSHCYLPAGETVRADTTLISSALEALARSPGRIIPGIAWTTDAPYRETAEAISMARAAGAVVVEMESAALYAFSAATRNAVLCFAHVTNQMGQREGDFEKGANDGVGDAFDIVRKIVGSLDPATERSADHT